MHACLVVIIRKRCDEAGVLNLKVSLEDGQVLSGFEDGSMDVVTCAWGLDSMYVYQTALEVRCHRPPENILPTNTFNPFRPRSDLSILKSI